MTDQRSLFYTMPALLEPRLREPVPIHWLDRPHEEAAREFADAHPGVEQELVRLARNAKSRGLESYGIKALGEMVRWHFRVDQGREEFAMNNNYTATFARMIMERHPDLEGFFETRESPTA